MVVHLADIQGRKCYRYDGRSVVWLQQDAGTVLEEPVEIQGKPVSEELRIESVILLDRGLPGHAVVADRAFSVCLGGIRIALTEIVVSVGAPCGRHIHESRGAEVVADFPERSPQLKVADEILALHERLFADDPAYRARWEGTVTGLARGEILRTVVADAHIGKIFPLVIIGGTADETHITVRNILVG